MSYQNKVALITGGASGLGKNLAETLHAQGASIIVADFNVSAGESFVSELNTARAGSAFFEKVNVTKWDEQVALFTAAKALVPRVDYVFVNAGVSFDGLLLHPDNQPEEFVPPNLTVLDINLYGMVYSVNLAVQLLRAQEVVEGFRGKIIVTASLAGVHAVPYMPLYNASKFGMVGLVRSLGQQLLAENITINAVAPDVVKTNIGPPEYLAVYDELKFETTKIEDVTSGFLSFLGDNKDSGEIREVSVFGTVLRPVNEVMPTSRACIASAPALEKIAYMAYCAQKPPKSTTN